MLTKKYCTPTERAEILRKRIQCDERHNKPYDTRKVQEYFEKCNYPHTTHLYVPEVQSDLLELSKVQKLNSVFFVNVFL
jgi:hypothetical protein